MQKCVICRGNVHEGGAAEVLGRRLVSQGNMCDGPSFRIWSGKKLTPFHKEGENAFYVADFDKLFEDDFAESQTIFANLVDVSTLHKIYTYAPNYTHSHFMLSVDSYTLGVTTIEQAQSIVQAVCQTAKEPWTLVLYNSLAKRA